jgi:hypothetical protein
MSQNDVIVLNANFATWQQRATGVKVDPWLYYCIEQFVKQYGLSDEEIQYGITDGGSDGGADAILLSSQPRPTCSGRFGSRIQIRIQDSLAVRAS